MGPVSEMNDGANIRAVPDSSLWGKQQALWSGAVPSVPIFTNWVGTKPLSNTAVVSSHLDLGHISLQTTKELTSDSLFYPVPL